MFTAPHESLLSIFKETYGEKLENDKREVFGFFRRSRIAYLNEPLTLKDIFKHALRDKGYRTRSILVSLGWINDKYELISSHPHLIEAYDHTHSKHYEPGLAVSSYAVV